MARTPKPIRRYCKQLRRTIIVQLRSDRARRFAARQPLRDFWFMRLGKIAGKRVSSWNVPTWKRRGRSQAKVRVPSFGGVYGLSIVNAGLI